MADDETGDPVHARHPVVSGLLALLAVGLSVGLILGGAALTATKVLGVGDDDTVDDDSSSGASLYLPRPERTNGPDGPLITLAPTDDRTGGSGPRRSERDRRDDEPEKHQISLSAGQTEVGQMEPIDLTGVYPGGEGAILQVQQFTDGKWDDFPVTTPVSNETFTTYIQASAIGLNRFRVVDTNSGKASNEVRVRIG